MDLTRMPKRLCDWDRISDKASIVGLSCGLFATLSHLVPASVPTGEKSKQNCQPQEPQAYRAVSYLLGGLSQILSLWASTSSSGE